MTDERQTPRASMRAYGLRRWHRRPGDRRDYVEWWNFRENGWDTPHDADGDVVHLANLNGIALTIGDVLREWPDAEVVGFDVVEDKRDMSRWVREHLGLSSGRANVSRRTVEDESKENSE